MAIAHGKGTGFVSCGSVACWLYLTTANKILRMVMRAVATGIIFNNLNGQSGRIWLHQVHRSNYSVESQRGIRVKTFGFSQFSLSAIRQT